LRPGQHVYAIGANVATRREIDRQVVQKAARVVTDSKEQALVECGDLTAPIRVYELGRARGTGAPLPL
jgi:ornithine cyclodeaminase/alanine dehydrogenase-like protein (mu-crystallin family)